MPVGVVGVKVDLLVGSDHYNLLVSHETREGGDYEPVACRTRLGWYLERSGWTWPANFIHPHLHCPRTDRTENLTAEARRFATPKRSGPSLRPDTYPSTIEGHCPWPRRRHGGYQWPSCRDRWVGRLRSKYRSINFPWSTRSNWSQQVIEIEIERVTWSRYFSIKTNFAPPRLNNFFLIVCFFRRREFMQLHVLQ